MVTKPDDITSVPTVDLALRSSPDTFSANIESTVVAIAQTIPSEINAHSDYMEYVKGAVDTSAAAASDDATSAAAAQSAAETARDVILNAQDAPLWVSGSDYASGEAVRSAVNGRSYVARSALTNNTTDPSSDAANWQLIAPIEFLFDDVSTLLASTDTAADGLAEGQILRTRKQGFSYEVAASGATDHQLTTAGGVKLYILPSEIYNFDAWGADKSGATSVQTELQQAIDRAHDDNRDLFIPAGTYLVTGLTIPGTVTGTDERGKAFRIYGQGDGEPFVANSQGTAIVSTTDAPVFQDILDTNPSSNGTFVMEKLRVQGTSDSNPVILLQSFYGLSRLRDMTVKNLGNGDGIEITYTATTELNNLYVMNGDATTVPLYSSRTGVGIKYTPSYDAGLFACRKVTARGWHTGFQIGDGADADFTTTIAECECSTVYNGIALNGTRGAIVQNCFMEGGERGIGVLDQGNYTTLRDNLIFAGFATGIDASDTSGEGTLIEGNIVNIGTSTPSVCCKVGSSAAFGGNSKTVRSNVFSYTLGTANMTGLQITGVSPVLDATNNQYTPRGGWTGSGTQEIDNQSTAETYGLVQSILGVNSSRVTLLQSGGVSYYKGGALTESNVVSQNMTIPDGSYFPVAPTTATTIQRFTCGPQQGRFIVLRSTNANATIQSTAYVKLAGGVSFNGIGTILFMTEEIGGSTYAYEISRSVF